MTGEVVIVNASTGQQVWEVDPIPADDPDAIKATIDALQGEYPGLTFATRSDAPDTPE